MDGLTDWKPVPLDHLDDDVFVNFIAEYPAVGNPGDVWFQVILQ